MDKSFTEVSSEHFGSERAPTLDANLDADYSLDVDPLSSPDEDEDDDNGNDLTRKYLEDESKVRSIGKALSTLSPELEENGPNMYSRKYTSEFVSTTPKSGRMIRKESGSEWELAKNPHRSQRIGKLIAEQQATKRVTYGNESRIRSLVETENAQLPGTASSAPTTPRGKMIRKGSPLNLLLHKQDKGNGAPSSLRFTNVRSSVKKMPQEEPDAVEAWFQESTAVNEATVL